MARIGLHVGEQDSNDPPGVIPADLGISCWSLRTPRGVPGKAVRCDNRTQANISFFPEANPAYNAYYMLRGLYDNAGDEGATCYIARAVGTGGAAATCFAVSAASAGPAHKTGSAVDFPIALVDGATLVANVTASGNETATLNHAPAELAGSGGTFAAISGKWADFRVGLTGALQRVTFAAENAVEEFAATLNAMKGVNVQVDGVELSITSDVSGTDGYVKLVAVTDAAVTASLGIALNATATGSGDVANGDEITFLELKDLIEASIDNSGGTVLSIIDGEVDFATVLTGGAVTLQIVSGAIATALGLTAGTYTGSASASANIWQLTAGQKGQEDPGIWANDKVYYMIDTASSGLTTQRDLVIYYQSDEDNAPVEKFRHKNLDNSTVAKVVSHPTKGSDWVMVAVVGTPTDLPDVMTEPAALSDGTPGTDPADPAETHYKNTLAAFNGLSVQVVNMPDLQSLLQGSNLETYCATRADVIGLFAAAQGATDADLEADYPSLLIQKSFVMGIRGWLRVDDERGGTILIPPNGHVVGAGFIRKLRQKGGYPHIAPAGPAANFLGVLEVDDPTYDDIRLTRVNATGFNPIVFQSGSGTFLKTSRTFSTLDKWYSGHVRVQANFFKTSFRRSFGVLEQEPNNDENVRNLRRSITDFMEDQYNHGGIETQDGGFAGNCKITCDTTNNDRTHHPRRLQALTRYRPTEVIEEIDIQLIRTTESVKTAEK